MLVALWPTACTLPPLAVLFCVLYRVLISAVSVGGPSVQLRFFNNCFEDDYSKGGYIHVTVLHRHI